MLWMPAFLIAVCMVGQNLEAVRPEFREGARVFVSELLEMDEPRDFRATEILGVLIRESVERYAFWRAQNIAYHHSPPALVTGRVSESHICMAVRELISTVCLDPDTKNREKFAITVLFEMCPAPRAAR